MFLVLLVRLIFLELVIVLFLGLIGSVFDSILSPFPFFLPQLNAFQPLILLAVLHLAVWVVFERVNGVRLRVVLLVRRFVFVFLLVVSDHATPKLLLIQIKIYQTKII